MQLIVMRKRRGSTKNSKTDYKAAITLCEKRGLMLSLDLLRRQNEED